MENAARWDAIEDGAELLETALEAGHISAEEFGHLHLLPDVGYRPNISAARRALMELLDARDGPVLNPLLDATVMLRRAIDDDLITPRQAYRAWVLFQEKRVSLLGLRERLRQLVLERQANEAEAVVTDAEARRADFEVVDGGGERHSRLRDDVSKSYLGYTPTGPAGQISFGSDSKKKPPQHGWLPEADEIKRLRTVDRVSHLCPMRIDALNLWLDAHEGDGWLPNQR